MEEQVTADRQLAAFLPMDRRLALAEELPTPADRAPGAVLFADLTGFTRLSETLVQQLGGRRGAEELSAQISRVYEALLEGVHGEGGSVVSFVGDALMTWFAAPARPAGPAGPDAADEDARLAHAARRARRAASAMQRALERTGTVSLADGTRVVLELRIGLSAGSPRRLLVGEHGDRLYDVLAGPVVDAAVRAEGSAAPGEIVASDDFTRFVSAELAARAVHDPAPRSGDRAVGFGEPVPLAAATVRPWLPPAVFRRFEAGAEFLSELRSAVPLFVRFDGLDFDGDDDVEAKLDRFVDGVLEILGPLEGTLLQVIAGDKGSHLYIVFGAPVGHDDDAVRALAAAIQIRGLAAGLPFLDSVRLGLHAGRVFAGLYGASSRLSYAVIGDPVNLAARLMSAATPGQILLSRRVADRAGAAFELRPTGEMRLKGKKAAVETFEAIGRRQAGSTVEGPARGALIGRAAELARLEAAVSDLVQGETRIFVLEGEAGIGKSRLIDELVGRTAARENAAVALLRGVADVVERRRAYHAWRGVFADLLGVRPGDDRAVRVAAATAAAERLVPDAARRLPLLSPVLDLGLEDNELTRQMTGEVRANNTIALLAGLLREAARTRSIGLVLEDAHWLDTASWALLTAVRREVEPIFVVVSTRPPDADAAGDDRELTRLLGDPRSERLGLGALEPEQAARLAAARLGVDHLPDSVHRLVSERSEGHPLFAQEIVLALRDGGTLIVEDGTARLADDAAAGDFELPSTIEGVVTSRIDRLTPDQQLVAKVAAVIGRSFEVSVLRGAFPASASAAADLEGHLAVLVEHAILEPPATPTSHSFTHAIIRDVTYETLLFAQRRTLHRSVAETLEADDADRAERFAVLAHHWERAEAPPRAVHYLEKAGAHAVDQFANAEAIAFLSRAEKLADGHPHSVAGDAGERVLRRARWRRLSGEARNGIGEFDRSHEDMRKALELLGRPEPGPGGMAARLVAELARQASHRWLRPGLFSRRSDAPAALEAARVYRDLVYPYYTSGNWLGGLYANWYMLNTVERFGGEGTGEGLLPHAKTNVAGAWLNILHNRRVGDRYLAEAREHARADNDLSALGWSFLVEGMVRVFNADLDEARVALDEALRIFKELGDPRHLDDTTYTLATWHFFTGDLDASLATSRDLLRSGRARDDLDAQLLGLGQAALCHALAGRYAEALEIVDEARAAARPGEQVPEQVFTAGVGVLALARSGEAQAALAAAREAAELLDAVNISNLAIEGFSGIADAILALEEDGMEVPGEVRNIADRAIKALAKNANALSRIHRPRAWWLRGRRDALDGKPGRARKRFERALAAARAIGLPYEEASAALALARLAAPGDPEAEAHLAIAGSLFSRLGTPWELARTRSIESRPRYPETPCP